jgi:hypothetical protein
MPRLHRALQREGRLPIHGCGDQGHRLWLRRLTTEPRLLPARLTLLTLPCWRDAGLVVHQPLRPLNESLWLLLRRGEAQRPELARLLQWWGGPAIGRRPATPAPWQWPAGLPGWRWWRRSGPES